MEAAALALELPFEEIEYPESDGEPMAETDDHRDDLAEIVYTLKRFFFYAVAHFGDFSARELLLWVVPTKASKHDANTVGIQ